MYKPKVWYLREMIEKRCSEEFAIWYERTGRQGWYLQVYNCPKQMIGRNFNEAKHLIMTTPLWGWIYKRR